MAARLVLAVFFDQSFLHLADACHYGCTMRDNEIIKLYQAGRYLVKDIARLAKRDQRTISKILKRNNIKIRAGPAGGNNKIDIDKNILQRFLDQNLTYDEIAKKLKIGRGTVGNKIREFGLKTKTATQSKAARNNECVLWDNRELDLCRRLLIRYRNYQIVADILNRTRSSVENKNNENWKIPMSIWTEREKEIKEYLEEARNYADVAYRFNVSEASLRYKNNRSWKIDLPMNSTLFGIPTRYSGILYRSKKEALIARYLFENNIKFEYEKQVRSGHNWTCDFYIPNKNAWIEYDGLEGFRDQTKSLPYNRNNPKIQYYKDNNLKFIVLNKRTWRQQLDEFFKEVCS